MVTMALSAKRQVILLGELCRQTALFPRNEVRVRLANSAHSGPPVGRQEASPLADSALAKPHRPEPGLPQPQ